jgi:hypothetical protein
MVRKYVAVLLALMLSGLAAPAFAGDYQNAKLLPQSFSLALASPAALAPRTTFGGVAGTVAFAMPQSGQPHGQSPQPSQPQAQPPLANHRETSGARKWGGIALMIGGGALIARGATVTDPCSGLSGPGVLCTSNYQEVRAASLGVGGAALIAGVVLFLHRHIN